MTMMEYQIDINLTEKFPSEYRSPGGLWYGFAARTRVLIVNTDLVPETERPQSIEDLIDDRLMTGHDRCRDGDRDRLAAAGDDALKIRFLSPGRGEG